jgi:hypothetical protein
MPETAKFLEVGLTSTLIIRFSFNIFEFFFFLFDHFDLI